MAYDSRSVEGVVDGRNSSFHDSARDAYPKPYVVNLENEERKPPVFFVVIFCILLLFALFCSFGLYYNYRRRRLRAARTSSTSSRTTTIDEPPEKRYYNIETWLITKVVHPHDYMCDLVAGRAARGNNNLKELRRRTSSVETISVDEEWGTSEDGNEKECPICFEMLEIGSLVSWSANPKCEHVFHHQCIKEWLLRQTQCPCCREKFLAIDHKRGNETMREIKQLIVAQQYRASPCFYCISHGIVRVPKFVPCVTDQRDFNNIQERAKATPGYKLLAERRGGNSLDCALSFADHESAAQSNERHINQTNVEILNESDELDSPNEDG